MSARKEKLRRRAALAEAGLTKSALREQHEFEAAVARVNLARSRAADAPIVSRQPRRRALAVAGLIIVGGLLLAVALAGC